MRVGGIKMSVDLNSLICFNFYNGWREITGFYKDILGMDVTPQKVYVLELLEIDKQITMNKLSVGMNLDSSAVSTLISRMEKKGLVKRTHGTEDRRTVFVKLTKEGYEAKQLLRQNFSGLTDGIGENISQKEISTLREIVSKVAKNHKNIQASE